MNKRTLSTFGLYIKIGYKLYKTGNVLETSIMLRLPENPFPLNKDDALRMSALLAQCKWTVNTLSDLTKEQIMRVNDLKNGTKPSQCAIRCAKGNQWVQWCISQGVFLEDAYLKYIQPKCYSVELEESKICKITTQMEARKFFNEYRDKNEDGSNSGGIDWKKVQCRHSGFYMGLDQGDIMEVCEKPGMLWIGTYPMLEVFIWNPDCITSIELVCDMSPPEACPEARSKPPWHGYGM